MSGTFYWMNETNLNSAYVFIAQSLSLLPLHHLDMTIVILKEMLNTTL